MGLIDDVGAGPVALDTVALIYFVVARARYVDAIRPLIMAANDGALTLVTSHMTLLEVMVVPYRAGNAALAGAYERLLTRSRGLTMRAMDAELLRTAAQLRARFGYRTPDAIQLATAVLEGCSALVTNDRNLKSLGALRVCQLDDFV